MIHGDTPTSGKFFDSIAFNLINIIIGMKKHDLWKYLPFTDIVPYENFVFFIDEKDFENISMLLKILYETPTIKLNYMISNMTYYKKYLLWNHKNSLVVDNTVKKAKKVYTFTFIFDYDIC